MSAAKRDSRSKQARTRRQAAEALLASEERPSPWLAPFAIALFVARLLVPAEDAANGGTLWLTQCWLLLAVFWIWDAFRRGCLKFRADRFDVCVGILVAGHVVSALYVFVEGGQRRAALNMLWEWVGLGVSVVLMRQLLRSRDDVRRFLWGLTAVVGALALFCRRRRRRT